MRGGRSLTSVRDDTCGGPAASGAAGSGTGARGSGRRGMLRGGRAEARPYGRPSGAPGRARVRGCPARLGLHDLDPTPPTASFPRRREPRVTSAADPLAPHSQGGGGQGGTASGARLPLWRSAGEIPQLLWIPAFAGMTTCGCGAGLGERTRPVPRRARGRSRGPSSAVRRPPLASWRNRTGAALPPPPEASRRRAAGSPPRAARSRRCWRSRWAGGTSSPASSAGCT